MVLVLITRGLVFDGIQDSSLSEVVPKDGEMAYVRHQRLWPRKYFFVIVLGIKLKKSLLL